MADKLTPKQKLFVEHYCGQANGNATEAASLAGYSGERATLATTGWENLRKPKIRRAIDKLLELEVMSAAEVRARLSRQARGSMGDVLQINDAGWFEVNLAQAKELNQLGLIQSAERFTSTTTTKDGAVVETVRMKVKLYSSQKALNLLGKMHGIFGPQQVEITGKDGAPVEVKTQAPPSAPEDAADWLGRFAHAAAKLGLVTGADAGAPEPQ